MGKEYEEIKSEISVRISTEDIDDIVTTALESGICYWCRRARSQRKVSRRICIGADQQRRSPGIA